MGFARRLLSSIGVGAATVDTKLEKEEFYLGEEVKGVIEIRGGDSEQEVDGIRLEVQTYYKRESGDNTVTETGTIERYPISGHTVIQEGQSEELPFSFQLPYDTPLSVGRTSVWVRTALDVKMAFDPSDSDKITVRPNRTIEAIFDAVKSLGFALHEADNEELPHRLRRRLPFGQEFEFKARRGEFKGRLDELEMVLFPDEGSVDVILQVDRRARGLGSFLSEQMGTDESYAGVTITDSDAEQGSGRVAEKLGQAIWRHS